MSEYEARRISTIFLTLALSLSIDADARISKRLDRPGKASDRTVETLNYNVLRLKRTTTIAAALQQPLSHANSRNGPFASLRAIASNGSKVRYLAVAARSGEGPFTYRLQTPNHRALQTVVC
jgi:hypothetical protein